MTSIDGYTEKFSVALAEALKEPGVFAFGDFHFKPYRNFNYGEVDKQLDNDSRLWKIDASYQFRNMVSDPAMQSLKGKNLHSDFYDAAKENMADIYYCVENGKLYVPCNAELMRYNEPTEKELRVAENKALKEYGSVIDSAIQSGVKGNRVPITLELLDTRFGKEKTDILLATVALTSLKNDGRISGGNRNWAMSVVEDTGNLKAIRVNSHPAHLDNLITCARQRDLQEQDKSEPKAEQTKPAPTKNSKAAEPPEKPSLLADLDASIKEAAQLAERKGANPAKKRGDLEVD
jgi:hypothetical protein